MSVNVTLMQKRPRQSRIRPQLIVDIDMDEGRNMDKDMNTDKDTDKDTDNDTDKDSDTDADTEIDFIIIYT